MLFRYIGGQLVAGPLGLVSTTFRWCRRWELFSAGGVRGKGTKQFLAVWHRATRRIPLRCPIFQTFLARHRIDCWAKGVRMEALQSSSLIKRDSIICCCGWAGGIHCMIVLLSSLVLSSFGPPPPSSGPSLMQRFGSMRALAPSLPWCLSQKSLKHLLL